MARSQAISWPMLLATTAIAIEFCISANVLTWAGVPYVTEGGVFPEKINPGTYLLCLAYAANVARQDRPNRALWSAFGGDPRLALYFSCLFSCLAYALLTTGTGNIIVLLDTFLPAGLLASIIRDATAQELRCLLAVFRCGICGNALLGLGEAMAHATLVPLYLNDLEYHAADGEFRPTALYDHPLTGGVMTLMGLSLAPHSGWLRFPYLAICSAALLSFGGRVALAAAVMSAILLSSMAFFKRVLHRDQRALQLLFWYGMSLIACAAIGVGSISAGLGERLLTHLYWDQSAQVRLAQWTVFSDLSVWQVLLGARREDMLALLAPLWLRSGVGVLENFWLLMFVSLGAIGFPIFVLAFYALLSWCWKRTGARGRVLLASFVIVVSTSNSLGRKSTLLVALVAAIACLPEWRPASPRAASVVARLPANALSMAAGR